MSKITTIPLEDSFETTITQTYNGGLGTIFVNKTPTFTFPSGVTTYMVINPLKTNMQIVEVNGYDAINKTITVSNITLEKGAGVNSTSQIHSINSKIIISDNYAFWNAILVAINSKLDNDIDIVWDSATTFAGLKAKTLTTAQRDALTPSNGMLIYNSDDGLLNQYISGVWGLISTNATINAKVDSTQLEYTLGETGIIGRIYSLGNYEQLTGGINNNFGSTVQSEISQSFYAQSINITDIKLMIKKISAPSDGIFLEIQTDNVGLPSGTVVTNGTSNILDFSVLNTIFIEETFVFAGIPTLTNGTLYHFVLKRTGANDAVNFYSAESAGTDSILGTMSKNTGTWANATDDLYFKLTSGYKITTLGGSNAIGICQNTGIPGTIGKFNTSYNNNQTGLIAGKYYGYNIITGVIELGGTFKAISTTELSLNFLQNATTTNVGLSQQATDLEAVSGVDNTKYITPKQAKDNYGNVRFIGTGSNSSVGNFTVAHNLGYIPKTIIMEWFGIDGYQYHGTGKYHNGIYSSIYSANKIGTNSQIHTYTSTTLLGYIQGGSANPDYKTLTVSSIDSTNIIFNTAIVGGTASTFLFKYTIEAF